ncbi:hypothetical protein [Spartinivicinus poritis]|uniref:Uncharacterized protein n=1 Tax=Spartinivicinus poritis TaxID=2994640 RepID=A0ABT5UDI8_9GAMM|nr:hypothetical protein [Spartinivicinus sp. A2-2]MDE1464433.1 hypothetical protein [Spartinivicinus sp. A2-2]
MKLSIIVISLLLSTHLFAEEDRALKACQKIGICVPNELKQEAISKCKDLLSEVKGEISIEPEWAKATTRKYSRYIVDGQVKRDSFFSVDLSATAEGGEEISFMCVFDKEDNFVNIGKPVVKTKDNMNLYRKAKEKIRS